MGCEIGVLHVTVETTKQYGQRALHRRAGAHYQTRAIRMLIGGTNQEEKQNRKGQHILVLVQERLRNGTTGEAENEDQ